MVGVGSSGRVTAWKKDGRFLLGYMTEALSLAETKPYTGVPLFTDNLVNRFFNPPPRSGLTFISYETYCLAIPIYHGEKCLNASSFELSKAAHIIGTWFIFHAP